MRQLGRLLTVTLLWLSSCSLGPGVGEPSPPAAIYVMNADGSGLEQVTAEAGYDLLPAWSPDGRRIAFARSPRTPGTAEADLFAVNVGGGREIRLTSGPADDADPAWSPDGQRLAFTRYASDAGAIMVVDADGSGVRPLTALGAGAMPSWSQDGRRLAFVRRAAVPVAATPWWRGPLPPCSACSWCGWGSGPWWWAWWCAC
jgi:Tol biopolymer transport system component